MDAVKIDIEMPKCCAECPLVVIMQSDYFCPLKQSGNKFITDSQFWAEKYKEDDCPLKECK